MTGFTFQWDSLAQVSTALYSALALVTFASLPKADRTAARLAGLACIVGGTLLAYASPTLDVFAMGWLVTCLPFWFGWLSSGPRTALAASSIALLAGAALLPMGFEWPVFVALTLAALLRKGIFPFHFWVSNAFAEGPLLELGLLLNGHLGAFAVIRYVIPLLPRAAHEALPFLSVLALFTALYTAIMALAETNSRRILALLAVSQASFLLAGLENRNVEGIAGALVHWFVVAAATTGLLCAYRALEARYPAVVSPSGYLGLANGAPRLSIFFLLCGLALIGLPGTLGFAAEDLLFHGSLESHPLLGITLPLATACNGITMYRLFSRLFLGRSPQATPPITDLRPREAWALSLTLLFLFANGIAPAYLVNLRGPAAEHLAALLGGR